MLAYRLERAERCQMCGTAEWEWDPKQGGRKFAYEPVTQVCKGCQAKEIVTEETDRLPGATVQLMPTNTRPWAQMQLRRQRREARRAKERD
jgi:hypothetical protein